MGFGTLFIGYFLLLNVTYYAWSDLIAALIMAFGLYKLSSVNRYFKYAAFTSGAFGIIGAIELVCQIIMLFSPSSDLSLGFLPILRSAAICALTVTVLFGIHDVAREVDLPSLAARARRMTAPAVIIYLGTILLDTPSLFSRVESIVVAMIFVVILIATIFLVIYNLITVYSAYMRICMPSDIVPKDKQSKFGFVNKFREYENEKSAEYARYKIEKSKNKANKK